MTRPLLWRAVALHAREPPSIGPMPATYTWRRPRQLDGYGSFHELVDFGSYWPCTGAGFLDRRLSADPDAAHGGAATPRRDSLMPRAATGRCGAVRDQSVRRVAKDSEGELLLGATRGGVQRLGVLDQAEGLAEGGTEIGVTVPSDGESGAPGRPLRTEGREDDVASRCERTLQLSNVLASVVKAEPQCPRDSIVPTTSPARGLRARRGQRCRCTSCASARQVV